MKYYRVVNKQGQYLTPNGLWTGMCYDAKNFTSAKDAELAKKEYGGSSIWAYVPR